MIANTTITTNPWNSRQSNLELEFSLSQTLRSQVLVDKGCFALSVALFFYSLIAEQIQRFFPAVPLSLSGRARTLP